MQCMNHTSVMLSYIRILDRSWEYRNKSKGTLTLPIHLLTGKQNNNCFFQMEFIPLDMFWSRLERS